MHRTNRFLVILAVAFIALLGLGTPEASAQRAAKAKTSATAKASAKANIKAKVTKTNGLRVSKWTANGVRFEHRTHGTSKIGWTRHTSKPGKSKSGTTSKFQGKLWGSKVHGTVKTNPDGTTHEVMTAKSPSGQTRITETKTSANGTIRKSITAKPEGTRTKTTEWTVGGTQMRSSRVTDTATGKTISKSRTGAKK